MANGGDEKGSRHRGGLTGTNEAEYLVKYGVHWLWIRSPREGVGRVRLQAWLHRSSRLALAGRRARARRWAQISSNKRCNKQSSENQGHGGTANAAGSMRAGLNGISSGEYPHHRVRREPREGASWWYQERRAYATATGGWRKCERSQPKGHRIGSALKGGRSKTQRARRAEGRCDRQWKQCEALRRGPWGN